MTFDVLQAANNLVDTVYLKQRRLDRKTKELIFIVSLTVMRASKDHIGSQYRLPWTWASPGRKSSKL